MYLLTLSYNCWTNGWVSSFWGTVDLFWHVMFKYSGNCCNYFLWSWHLHLSKLKTENSYCTSCDHRLGRNDKGWLLSFKTNVKALEPEFQKACLRDHVTDLVRCRQIHSWQGYLCSTCICTCFWTETEFDTSFLCFQFRNTFPHIKKVTRYYQWSSFIHKECIQRPRWMHETIHSSEYTVP